jgi:membrane-bound lytic murein transglycosylase MltF
MNLDAKQKETLEKVRKTASALGIDPDWAAAVAMVESGLGLYQLSKTGAKGVFQMTTIAMKDLLLEMEKKDDDIIDIVCGILFLRLLLTRHKTINKATAKYCDPMDRGFYVDRVNRLMKELKEDV